MSINTLNLSPSTFRNVLLIILLINILSRAIVISRPLPYLDSLIIPDDAYISLHIAKNMAAGKGPLYGLDYTNGFQPLYVFAMVPVFWAFPTDTVIPVKIALFVLTLFDTATLYVLLLFVFALTRNQLLTLLSAVFWIFNDYIIQTSLNGLETIMASFFILWATYTFYKLYNESSERKPGQLFSLGLITGFACISRVDSGIFASILFALIFFKELKNRKTLIPFLASFGVGVAIIFSVWIAYSYYYTGAWYPISGKAVRFLSLTTVQHQPTWSNWYRPLMEKGFSVIGRQNAVVLAIMIIPLVFLLIRKKISTQLVQGFLAITLFSISLYFAYTLYIFTPYYFYRYFFPIALFLILLFIQSLNTTLNILDVKYQKAFLYGICILWISAQVVKGELVSYYTSKKSDYGYMNLGVIIKDKFPDGTIIGGSQTGALSYFADNLTVINLDGVVNEAGYLSLVNRENMDYIKRSNIEYIIGWESNRTLVKEHSQNFKESDLEMIEEIKGLKTWDRKWYIYKVNK